MKRKFSRQIFAILLAMAVAFSSMPTQVLAQQEETASEKQVGESQENWNGNLETTAKSENANQEELLESDQDQISQQEVEEATKDTSNETTEDVSNQTAEDVSSETTEDVSNQTAEDVSNETTEDVSNETAEDASNETTEDVSNQTTEDVSNETTKEETDQVQNETASIEEEGAQQQADEIAQQKTTVIRTTDYGQYYEENLKLVNQYPSLSDSQSPYASRRILGKMREKVDLENYGAVMLLIGPDNSFVLQFDTEEKTEQAFLRLSSLTTLEYCNLDGAMPKPEPVKEGDKISAEDNDWDKNLLELDQFVPYVKKNAGTKTITVCVLDTGVDASHPALKDLIVKNVSGASYTDSDGHGTHVAGIVARCFKGIRSNVKILPIKGIGQWSLAVNGTKLAVSKGAKVINMSFGTTYDGMLIKYDCYEPLHDAIDMATKAGVSVVIAAGNNGYTNLKIEDYNECPSHLGIKDGIITVANVDKNQERVWDSGYGTSVDLAAPGEDIYSTYRYHGWEYMSGTSMATPHITAIVAMLYLLYPDKTPAEMENLLKVCCEDLGTKGRDNYYGYGIPKMSLAIAGNEEKLDEKHTWSTTYTVDKKATCTTAGSKSIHCTDCGLIKPGSTQTIKALDHDKSEKITKATLTKSGSIITTCSRCSYSKKTIIYYPKTIKLAKTKYSYTGTVKKPTVKVTDANGAVVDSSNYTVTYEGERIKAGTYNVKIAFKGKKYSGTKTLTFQIVDERPYQQITSQDYTKIYGDKAFTIKANLTQGDGTLSFTSSNKNTATISQAGKVTIKNIGNTTITITASETVNYKKTTKKITIRVRPKKLAIATLKHSASKSMDVTWKKDPVVDGYELEYATNASFSSPKVIYINSNATTSKRIKNLTKGKRYYVRLCSYKEVNGTTYYSAWSAAKYVRISK